ncbi:MAG TPA: cell division protein ZipA [Rhodanobacteraceae bacterium]|jgi:cell division protein ZipA|nr:cell division protein ZipA [Rhodanobacteraceae bacterium]
MDVVSAGTLRIILIIIGVLILAGIYFFARPREQGRRLPFRRRGDARVEPVLGDTSGADAADDDGVPPEQGELDVALERELHRLGATVTEGRRAAPSGGERPPGFSVDKIVTLYVTARAGESLRGSDIVVASEKAGLRFGAMRIFHRLVDGKPDAGPVFSMANMMKPGYFDMDGIADLETPGLSFFITLPGPLPALDAWDTMLPAAQRIAELLDGELLDEDHNALGRQRIAGLREELREWDRRHEGTDIKPVTRR